MNREEAEADIHSSVIGVRLKAARFFSTQATPHDLPALRRVLRKETVPWIRRALERAIDLCDGLGEDSGAPAGPQQSEPSEALVRDLRAEAVEEVAGTILHEFAAVIGALRISAREEISTFEFSETKKLLDQLAALIEAVRNLKKSASVPNYSQFDLASLVDESLGVLGPHQGIVFQIGGARPFLIEADRAILGLAILNGLRNAIEAVESLKPSQPGEIDINWGRGGAEDWLVIMDNGPGFSGDPANALKLGVTNKLDHIGYGLATAQYAMRSMEGDVLLSNAPDRGARFELRWYKDHANPLR